MRRTGVAAALTLLVALVVSGCGIPEPTIVPQELPAEDYFLKAEVVTACRNYVLDETEMLTDDDFNRAFPPGVAPEQIVIPAEFVRSLAKDINASYEAALPVVSALEASYPELEGLSIKWGATKTLVNALLTLADRYPSGVPYADYENTTLDNTFVSTGDTDVFELAQSYLNREASCAQVFAAEETGVAEG